MKSTSLFPLSALLLALTSGCVDSLSEESRPCPCTDGWTCCASTQTCVPDGTACPAPTPGKDGPEQTPDVVPPVTPVLRASIPVSPTASATVTLDGTTEPGAAVALFTTADCSGTPAGVGTADAAGGFRVSAPLRPNASTSFWARATDAARNASPCSAEPLRVLHDGVAPGRPVLESLTPGPLSRTSTHPVLSGIAEPRSTVQLFIDAACTQALPFSATADEVGAFRLWASVEADSTTPFHVRAVDAVGNASPCSTTSLGFTHDGTPPAAPRLGAFGEYVTRAEADAPGTAEALSEVTLYAEEGCAGEPVATGATLADGTFTLRFPPRRNTANTLTARATDAAGNTSACSTARTFLHDDTPPRMPWALYTQPSSPSASRTPALHGYTEPGATVRVYTSSDCTESSSSRVFTGQAWLSESFRVQVEAHENTWTFLSATATDAAGNVSACATSAPRFLHDSVPPPPPLLLTAELPMPYSGTASSFSASGMAEAGARIQLYDNPTCTGTPVKSQLASTPKDLPWGDFSWVTSLVQPEASITYHATASDTAGNTSACSATSVTVARTPGRGWRDGSPVSESARPALALNDAGQAVAVWRTSTPTVRVAFSTSTGWTPATQLSGADATVAVAEPAVALSSSGYAFAAWQESMSSRWQLRTRLYVPGQDWQPPLTLSNEGASATQPTLAADAAGNALALWLEYAPSNSDTKVLWSARFTPAGGWQRPERLSTGTASLAHLSMSASGHAWAVWPGSREGGGGDVTWSSHYTAGQGWSPPEVLDIPVRSTTRRYVAFGTDDAGGVTMAWLAGDTGAHVWTRRFVPGQGWGSPSRLTSQEGALLSVPHLAVNARGEALAAWRNEERDVKYQSLWGARFTPEGGWSGATLLQDGPGPFEAYNGDPISLGIDDAGAGLVTFIRPKGTRLYGNLDSTMTPPWVIRFEPASGWSVPSQVGNGTTAHVSLVMNAKGEALVTWDVPQLAPFRTSSRWFR